MKGRMAVKFLIVEDMDFRDLLKHITISNHITMKEVRAYRWRLA